MLIDNLKAIVDKNKKETNFVFLRNLLKETLQCYVLNYVYSSEWGKSFLFKGGTCLRFCFDFPRLSEDLDFDIKNYQKFDIKIFDNDLKNYFAKQLQYKEIETKIAGNNKQFFLKFPIMERLGFKKNRSESNLLFLRLDLNSTDSSIFKEKISLYSSRDFNFIIKRYSLADLFASKITAILQRSFLKGKKDLITFKGRDYFDLIWFLERGVKPNFQRLKDITGFDKKVVSKKLDEKVNAIDIKYLKEDLSPLFASQKFVNEFCGNFKKLYEKHRCPHCGSVFTYLETARSVGASPETSLPQLTNFTYKCNICEKAFHDTS